jgi:hypothetical protein
VKIQQLLQREPFGDILEKTLSRFLSSRFGGQYQVRWRRRSAFDALRRSRAADFETWYCNPFLNAIFSAKVDQSVFDLVRESYIQTPFYYRRYPQQLYVTLATRRVSAPFLTTHVLNISPQLHGQENMLILGGNNRIRLLDLKMRRTWDILKYGFDPACMLSELAAHRRPGPWPFPTLRAVAEDGTWYESDHISAISLNRLKRKQDRPSLLASALKTLGQWLDQTATTSTAMTYAGRLVEEIRHLFRRGALFSIADQQMIQQWLVAAVEIMSAVTGDKELPVELAQGHGDFQDGNILVDADSRVWIVDWEHANQRQLAYDYLVLSLRSRFPDGLASRIQAALHSHEFILQSLPFVHPHLLFLLKNTKRRSATLVLFLLEDLLWNLQENVNPLFRCLSGAWLLLRNEMGPALRSIAAA